MGRCKGRKQGFENAHFVDVDTESETVVLQKRKYTNQKTWKRRKTTIDLF